METKESAAVTLAPCPACGRPRDPERGDAEDRECHECRSVEGRLGELDLAIRLAEKPNLLDTPQWLAIRKALIEKYGDKPDVELLDELKVLIGRHQGIDANEVMRLPVAELAPTLKAILDKPPAGEALTDEDVRILTSLSKSESAMAQADIEAASLVSRKTISKRLELLRKSGLVQHPEGRQRGECITESGRDILAKMAGAKLPQ